MSSSGDFFDEIFGVGSEGKYDVRGGNDPAVEIAAGVVVGTAVSAAVFSCFAIYFYCRD
ncbi:MAG: hypothetical protein Q4B94_03755 [Pseudomonadota bacterium]|nr:hypothetical protein [Pseudomonadota bacterium]